MKYIVYCTTCLINGKIYIGVHKTENPDVFDGYYGNGVMKGSVLRNPKTLFQRAIKKYGHSNFKRAVLYIFDTPEEAYNKEAELVTPDFIKRTDNYNMITGGGGSYGSHTRRTKFYRYKLTGEFWEEFSGIAELKDRFDGCERCFYNACDQRRSYKNSFWSFEKVDKLPIEEYCLNKFSTIYQFDKEGVLIKEWDCSVKELCQVFDVTEANMLSGLNKKTMVKEWYFLKNKSKIFDILESKKKIPVVKVGETIQMEQYDLDGNLIKVWPSIKECAKHFSKCRDVAKGLRKQTKGYIFKYKS